LKRKCGTEWPPKSFFQWHTLKITPTLLWLYLVDCAFAAAQPHNLGGGGGGSMARSDSFGSGSQLDVGHQDHHHHAMHHTAQSARGSDDAAGMEGISDGGDALLQYQQALLAGGGASGGGAAAALGSMQFIAVPLQGGMQGFLQLAPEQLAGMGLVHGSNSGGDAGMRPVGGDGQEQMLHAASNGQHVGMGSMMVGGGPPGGAAAAAAAAALASAAAGIATLTPGQLAGLGLLDPSTSSTSAAQQHSATNLGSGLDASTLAALAAAQAAASTALVASGGHHQQAEAADAAAAGLPISHQQQQLQQHEQQQQQQQHQIDGGGNKHGTGGGVAAVGGAAAEAGVVQELLATQDYAAV
jgi:hypothetical protein